MRLSPGFKRRTPAFTLGALSFALTLGAGQWLLNLELERTRSEHERELRGQLEELHQALHLELSTAQTEVNGLADWLGTQEAPNESGFHEISERLIARHVTLLSTTDLPEDVIARTHPDNPKRVGLDVGKHPVQGTSVTLMKTSLGPVVGGPIQLKQGGLGMIIRSPILRAEHREYVGHASLVFDVGALEGLLHSAAEQRGLALSLVDADGQGLTASFALQSGSPPEIVRDEALDAPQKRTLHFAQEEWLLTGQSTVLPPAGLIHDTLAYGRWFLALLIGSGAYWGLASALAIRRRNHALARSEQEALAARDAKSAFLATMSHELRTPMNGVIASAELLKDAELSDPQQELATTIVESGEALLHIINDILDFSKLESGKVQLSPEPTDLVHVITSLGELFRPLASQKGIEFYLELPESLPPAARLDGHRLRQILTNLLSNAVKFTEEGSARLSAELDKASNQLVFTVLDTGIGIEAPEKLFGEFVQADASTTRRFGGTGLGLAISRKLALQMGGALGAKSKLGEGSEFRLELPYVAAELSKESPPDVLRELRPGNALVVDDNAVNRRIALKVLAKFGWKAEVAENGRDALHQVEAHHYDLVLMDCAMPEMDGYEATRRIRELAGEVSRVPVIAMTANALPEDRQRCLEAGMNDFLTKPLEFPQVRNALLRHAPPIKGQLD